ncbi:MAG: hypothetical protein ABIC68_00605 [Candidatus Omnitrophota bacterium]
MKNYFIRVAQELSFDLISKHLLVVGDLTGDCFSCRAFGIDYTREKYCPGCKTDFRYICFRKAAFVSCSQISKLCQKRPDLVYVEYGDIKDIADRIRAKNFFK